MVELLTATGCIMISSGRNGYKSTFLSAPIPGDKDDVERYDRFAGLQFGHHFHLPESG